MKTRLAVLLLLLAASSAEAAKPVLAVLPFESAADRGKMGRFVRKALFDKLARTYQYIMVEPMDVDDMIRHAGLKLSPATEPKAVASFALNVLQCRFILWGEVTRASRGWIIRVRGMDVQESKTELEWHFNEEVTSHRDVPLACNEIVGRISGFARQVGREPEVPEAKRSPEPRKNLLPNGDFEQGKDSPAQWQQVDNLTTFWDRTGGNPGKCLLVDTDVLETQALAWRERIAKGADFRKPPDKEPTKPPKYDTIGGTYGVHFISDPIPVKRGVVYRLNADVKGKMSGIFFPKIFVKGYAAFEATSFSAQDREIYRMYLACRTKTQGREFEPFTRTFLPNAFYCVLDLENAAGTDHAAEASAALRAAMRKKNFPQIPLEDQVRRLAGSASVIKYDTVMPEILLTVRDKLLCAHAIYGKVDKTDEGLTLFLRLMSARIKRNIPLLDLKYPIGDDKSIADACDKFLTECERRLPFVSYVRVIPYSYWPPGLFRYDNLVLTEEGETLW